jgi:superfamily II DNA or RNA helicase
MSNRPPRRLSRDELQTWCRERVYEHFDSGGKSGVIRLPTGVGKTRTATGICVELGSMGLRTLWIADRRILVRQAAADLERAGMQVEIEMAQASAVGRFLGMDLFGRPDAVVATIQSLSSKDRYKQFPKDSFDLIVFDEAHKFSPQVQAVLDHFEPRYHLGLTATPRPDTGPIFARDGAPYERLVVDYQIIEAVQDGHLVPCRDHRLAIGVDLKDVRKKKGEIDPVALEERLIPLLQPLAQAVFVEKKRLGLGQVVVFMPDVKSTVLMGDTLRSLAKHYDRNLRIEAIWGVMPEAKKEAVLDAFSKGEIDILVNCEILVAGWDHPPLAGIFLYRALESLTTFTQIVGRVLRLYPGKEWAHVFGPSWENYDGDICCATDLFAADETDQAVCERAAKIRDEEGQEDVDPMSLLDRARQELEEEKASEEELALRAMIAEHRRHEMFKLNPIEVAYEREELTPFGVGALTGAVLPEVSAIDRPARSDQLKAIRQLGGETDAAISESAASSLLDHLRDRKQRGLTTPKQIRWLVRSGYTMEYAQAMRSKDATTLLLDRMQRNRYARRGKQRA